MMGLRRRIGWLLQYPPREYRAVAVALIMPSSCLQAGHDGGRQLGGGPSRASTYTAVIIYRCARMHGVMVASCTKIFFFIMLAWNIISCSTTIRFAKQRNLSIYLVFVIFIFILYYATMFFR